MAFPVPPACSGPARRGSKGCWSKGGAGTLHSAQSDQSSRGHGDALDMAVPSASSGICAGPRPIHGHRGLDGQGSTMVVLLVRITNLPSLSITLNEGLHLGLLLGWQHI